MHKGIDVKHGAKTPVVAVADNCVVTDIVEGCRRGNRSCGRGYGNQLKLRCGDLVFQYNHLSSVSKRAKAGGKIPKGTILGSTGSTGVSTGPHLDFMVYKNGGMVNPLSVYPRKKMCKNGGGQPKRMSSCGAKNRRIASNSSRKKRKGTRR